MFKSVKRVAEENQRVEYYIDPSDTYEDFEYLIEFIQKEYGPLFYKGRQGVGMNTFQVKIDGMDIVFYQLNEIGCRFYSKDGKEYPILKKIADKLSKKKR